MDVYVQDANENERKDLCGKLSEFAEVVDGLAPDVAGHGIHWGGLDEVHAVLPPQTSGEQSDACIA